jgi:hypothetical protein
MAEDKQMLGDRPASRSSSTEPTGLLAVGALRRRKLMHRALLSTAKVESTTAPMSHPVTTCSKCMWYARNVCLDDHRHSVSKRDWAHCC